MNRPTIDEQYNEQQQKKNKQPESHQDAGPVLTFLCGIMLGAAIQSLVFQQWVLAGVELVIMAAIMIGALLGATIPQSKKDKGEKI